MQIGVDRIRPNLANRGNPPGAPEGPATPPGGGHPPVDYDPGGTGSGPDFYSPGPAGPGGAGTPAGGGNPLGGQANPMPWLQGWEGGFAAPMSPAENQGLAGMQGMAQNDFGLGQASDYLGRVFGGDYLSGNEPNFQAIQDSGETLKQMEDDRAMKEMQSRAAAGGNALSGALIGQEGDYMRGSNAQFQNMMAQLRAANYGRERGFQQDAVQGARGLAGDRMSGYGALMGAGAVGRDIADREMGGQYNDFIRQGRDFRDAYQYPDQLALQTAHLGYPGSSPQVFGESDASGLSAMLAQIFGSGGGADWGSILGDFIGGVSGGDGGAVADTNNDGVPAYDGDSEPFSSASYRDSKAYNAELTKRQAIANQKQTQAGKASGANKAMTIMALLMQVLGLGKGKQQGKGGGAKGGGAGGGGSLAQKAGEGIAGMFDKNPYRGKDPKAAAAWDQQFKKGGAPKEQVDPSATGVGSPTHDLGPFEKLPETGYGSDSEGSNPFNMEGFSDDGFEQGQIWDTPGASIDENGLGQINWDDYGYPGDVGGGGNQELSDFLGGIPDDFSSDFGGGGGDYASDTPGDFYEGGAW